jgi:hypothetical protein
MCFPNYNVDRSFDCRDVLVGLVHVGRYSGIRRDLRPVRCAYGCRKAHGHSIANRAGCPIVLSDTAIRRICGALRKGGLRGAGKSDAEQAGRQ